MNFNVVIVYDDEALDDGWGKKLFDLLLEENHTSHVFLLEGLWRQTLVSFQHTHLNTYQEPLHSFKKQKRETSDL
jgi:hypothetical protein